VATLLQMQTRAALRFRDPANALITAATWTDHLNAAYDEYSGATRWPFLLTTGSFAVPPGGHRISVGSNVASGIKDVYDLVSGGDEPRMLLPVPDGMPWKERVFLEWRVSGVPLFWEIQGANLYVLPAVTVNTTLEVNYYTDVTPLAAGTDVPVFPARYHEALVEGALGRAYQDDGNAEASKLAYGQFSRLVKQAMAELETVGQVLSTKGTLQESAQMAPSATPQQEAGQ
jgi:hypothetical protein